MRGYPHPVPVFSLRRRLHRGNRLFLWKMGGYPHLCVMRYPPTRSKRGTSSDPCKGSGLIRPAPPTYVRGWGEYPLPPSASSGFTPLIYTPILPPSHGTHDGAPQFPASVRQGGYPPPTHPSVIMRGATSPSLSHFRIVRISKNPRDSSHILSEQVQFHGEFGRVRGEERKPAADCNNFGSGNQALFTTSQD